MKPGETLTVSAGDRVQTVVRTSRNYIYDLCDAANAACSAPDRLEWYVTPNDTLALRHRPENSRKVAEAQAIRQARERARFKQEQGLNNPQAPLSEDDGW